MDEIFKKNDELLKMDTQEMDLPETTYIRDIDSRVFQGIILQCLSKIEGIGLIGGNLIDSLFGRDIDRIKGIVVEQDLKKHSVLVRVEINVLYGISIPEKAEEVQNKIIEEITTYTGLHVSCVHVIFKNLITSLDMLPEGIPPKDKPLEEETNETEYSHGF
jgi:uncharacterized alkaline shock family protein YloU